MNKKEYQLLASTMASGGLIDGTHFQEIPSEAIAFHWIDITSKNVKGVHAPLQYDLVSLAKVISQPQISPQQKLNQLVIHSLMKNTKDIVKTLEQDPTPRHLVLHPDVAAGLLLDSIDGKVKLPLHLTYAIENDDAPPQSHHLNRLLDRFNLPKVISDPRHPSTVDFLANAYQALHLPVARVLDIEHLNNSHPNISVPEAISLMGGVNILHLSGPHHHGLSEYQITTAINEVLANNPTQTLTTVVLEGPTPRFKLLPTSKETAYLRQLIANLNQTADK